MLLKHEGQRDGASDGGREKKRQGVTCHIAGGLTFNRFSVFKTPHLKAPKAQVVLVSFENSQVQCVSPLSQPAVIAPCELPCVGALALKRLATGIK